MGLFELYLPNGVQYAMAEISIIELAELPDTSLPTSRWLRFPLPSEDHVPTSFTAPLHWLFHAGSSTI